MFFTRHLAGSIAVALFVAALAPDALAQSACDQDCAPMPPRVYLGSVQEREKVTFEVAPDLSQINRVSGTVWCTDSTDAESQQISFAPSSPFPISQGRVSVVGATETIGDVTFTYSLDASFAQNQLRGSINIAANACASGDQAFVALRQ